MPSRAGDAIKRAVSCGVDVIYHCAMADSEALDLLEAARDRLFVGPAIGLIHNTLYEAEAWGITRAVARDLGIERWARPSPRTSGAWPDRSRAADREKSPARKQATL